MKNVYLFIAILCNLIFLQAQNFDFDFNTTGRRVCLVSTEVDLNTPEVKILFNDYQSNSDEFMTVNRRLLGEQTWTNVAVNIPPGTAEWVDADVGLGEVWEYQIVRENTWFYNDTSYSAIGYTIGSLLKDNTTYKGQIILLVADDVPTSLSEKYTRLKKEITADGWFINELIVPRATGWDTTSQVVTIKNEIVSIYNAAPSMDKPQILFILGHVEMPRSGSADVIAPDGHSENRGARSADAFYADIDGVYTDLATYNPSGLSTMLAENYPNDYKWDQDYLASDVEMAFGRVDFADVVVEGLTEMNLIESYLDKLSAYKNVDVTYEIGENSAFNIGYDNSTDASYRSLLNISSSQNVYQNYTGVNHSQWVQDNGPFKIYMQNVNPPDINEWQTLGMDAVVYSSDQSYWGYNDIPNSTIRTALAIPTTKNLITLWTTSAINLFHQACTGEPLGLAMKNIINHNQDNQYLEKPQQDWDTPDWWNRTHLTINGDPTLNLYQVSPAQNLYISEENNMAVLHWDESADSSVLGYHVYESSTEFGIFERISPTIINATQFTIPDYQEGHWYMIKAIDEVSSGCGVFLHASIGTAIIGDIALSSSIQEIRTTTVFPNPTTEKLNISSVKTIKKIQIYAINGQLITTIDIAHTDSCQIDLSQLDNGLYIMRIIASDDTTEEHKIKKIKGNHY